MCKDNKNLCTAHTVATENRNFIRTARAMGFIFKQNLLFLHGVIAATIPR
jgi:hypothetical protein